MTQYPPVPGVPLPVFEDGTPEWQEQRREGIGSSDASIILGLSQYHSPRSLWMDKTGRAPYERVTPEMERLRHFGHIMEPVIRELTATELGVGIMKPEGAVRNEQIPWLRANLDGWTTDGRVAEFKNVHQSQAYQWDGQIPDHAELQVHHSGLVLGVRYAVVGGLIGGNRIAVYELDLNSSVADIVYEAEAAFWKYVETDTPPPVDGIKRPWIHCWLSGRPGQRLNRWMRWMWWTGWRSTMRLRKMRNRHRPGRERHSLGSRSLWMAMMSWLLRM